MNSKDRRASLLKSTTVNGIDFVEVATADQKTLRVHFFNNIQLKGTLPSAPTITGGETIALASILDADWSTDGGHVVLTLRAVAPGDFSNYTLTLTSDFLDPIFTSTTFSFKARCPSDLDCAAPPPACPTVSGDPPPIDYLAKDFLGFRQALLDFSALRYPQWQERSEADFGLMFIEALSALADDLSYTQDRIAAEASLATATQRRSVVRHARLVDYEPRPATTARVLLQFNVADGTTSLIDGLRVSATGPDGSPVVFETGTTLLDRLIDPKKHKLRPSPPSRTVSSAWNSGILPYWFDDSQQCLPAGVTQIYILGHGYGFTAGQQILIQTQAATSADPPIRQVVEIVADPIELWDPLFPPPQDTKLPSSVTVIPPAPNQSGTAVTLLRWGDADRLATQRDLTRTTLAGNLIPATQAVTFEQRFLIPSDPPPGGVASIPTAAVRIGPNDAPGRPSLEYLYTLPTGPLAWIGSDAAGDSPEAPLPEIVVMAGPSGVADDTMEQWRYLRWLLDADQFDAAFTLEAARYRPVAGQTGSHLPLVHDYDGDGGDTIRFGDGTFGNVPLPGAEYRVIYRVGRGATGDVAADTITRIEPRDSQADGIIGVTNPFPANDGNDPEPLDHVRRMAPQLFRATRLNAVIPSDYEEAAGTLPWVQRAGTVFRWTGSWLTVFTTPDPLHSQQITVDQRTELIDLLNRRRLAGYESYVPSPLYLSLDVAVEVCARPGAFRDDVAQAVLEALTGPSGSTITGGFFSPDNFTFGQPLERGGLEAAVQRCLGVAGVTCVRFRARGRTTGLVEMPAKVLVAIDQIIRCDNDPSQPEHGSLKVVVEGGK